MEKKYFIFLLLFSSLVVFSGCQKLTPKLPEETEATIQEILENPKKFQDAEVKLTGVLISSKKNGLVLREEGFEIKVSTESSGIAAEDFLDKEVELGGVLKEGAEEPILEMSWVGVIPKEEAIEVAEEKKAALASVLEIDVEKIEVVSSEAVDWSDTSLGAPEPGKMYAQVITPGFKIIYKAEGKTYEVHTNQDGTLAVLLEPRTEL